MFRPSCFAISTANNAVVQVVALYVIKNKGEGFCISAECRPDAHFCVIGN